MTDLYLAVGHGVEPNGVYDPGAIGADGRQEHLEAFETCIYANAALRRSGVSVVCETAQGASHDPDYRGSALRANALAVRLAVEVHFDYRAGVDGFSGLYVSGAGQHLAALIGEAFVERKLPRAHDVKRTDLYFLNVTHMPALIPEIRRTLNYSTEENKKQGEALAEGICHFLGKTYKKPGPPPSPPLKHWEIVGPEGVRRRCTEGELHDYFDRQQEAHKDDPPTTPDQMYVVTRKAAGYPPEGS